MGQGHIVTTLINQIKSETISHAYLFTGTRGTGKTSSAKIFARAVNCLTPQNGSPCNKCANCLALADTSALDIIEMDAASNNGVEEIRELRENVQYPPSVGKYKVYIIDEVHMLTPSAFNALLKTLEEPPAHIIFILATTEAHKLPATILSRCMRFDFRLVETGELTQLLEKIFNAENYPYDNRATELLALHGEGSARDAISLADMCMSFAPQKLTYEAALEVLGASDFATLFGIAQAALSGDIGELLTLSGKVAGRGKGVTTLSRELTAFFRTLLAIKNIEGYKASFSENELAKAKELTARFDNYRLGRTIDILSSVENAIRYSAQPAIIFEASLVKAAELSTEPSLEGVLSRIRGLETKLKSLEENGITVAKASKPVATTPIATQETKNGDLQKNGESPISASADTNKDIQIIDLVLEEDAAPIFSQPPNEVNGRAEYEAKQVLGSLLTQLREGGHTLLYLALQNQEDITLRGTTLVIRSMDNAAAGLFNDESNFILVNQLIKEVMGDSYSFSIQKESEDSEKLAEDKVRLIDFFGDKLIDKTIK